jgi:hypothetical protein
MAVVAFQLSITLSLPRYLGQELLSTSPDSACWPHQRDARRG